MSTRIFLGIPGNLAPPGSGGLSFSSDTSGVQTTLTGFTRVITSSFDLSFAHVDDWETTEQTGQDCTYRYTFERTGDDITRQAVDPLGSAPASTPPQTLSISSNFRSRSLQAPSQRARMY